MNEFNYNINNYINYRKKTRNEEKNEEKWEVYDELKKEINGIKISDKQYCQNECLLSYGAKRFIKDILDGKI